MSSLARRYRRAQEKKNRKDGDSIRIEPARRARVSVSSPCGDLCHTMYMTAMLHMVAYTLSKEPAIEVNFCQYGTSVLPMSPQLLVAQALDNRASHVLFIDSDMVFPFDMIARLLRHDVAVVGANCMSRRPPYRLTAQVGGKELVTTKDSTGIEKVDRLGTGVLMVRTDVFRALELPWFAFEWLGGDKPVLRGEDYYFSEKAKAAGFELYVDHDISKQVQHLGCFGLNPLMREPMLAMQQGATP